ncbi:Gfo/Idh/MocA family protein [Scatolibacter rhodanostii]|uniref:Gfo/Idh/MocA family protein n=1 Tax=Scatolibacter rhodanostii TaxID=2014781 RepID=UPI000C0727B5|nr:Gfo/Idh/MocA family oxidoreductase [Scatolibacter rhodanostii]
MLKVAMLSKWHVHAKDYAQVVQESDLAEITAVWDDNAERGLAWSKELNCQFYEDLDELLADSSIDAVICDTPTTQHFEVISKAVKAGKHIFTEKVLAATVEECEKLTEMIEKAGITFTISYPLRSHPIELFAKEKIDNGEFGKINLIRFRRAHNGTTANWLPNYWYNEEEAGGGALMDLGCHPMYLADWLLTKPKHISAFLSSPFGTKVDEMAAVTIESEDGAVFVGETSFVSFFSPDTLEIYGSDATLIAIGDDVKYASKEIGYTFVTPKLPAARPLPIELFLKACVDGTGTPKGFTAADGTALTKLIQNAYLSNEKKQTITL